MAGKKHLFLIHGRSTKPAGSKKEELATKALLHGLARVEGNAATAIKDGRVDYSLVYYGDISNKMMLEKDKKLRKKLSASNDDIYGNEPCERPDRYDDDMDRLFAQTSHSERAYDKLLKEHKDRSWMDNVGRVVSFLSSMTGLSDNLVRAATADMGAYLMTRKIGSAVRERLQGRLKAALLAGEDVCVVSHSMGCIVTYDVLWKLSQMSEYRDVQDAGNRVKLWLTIGNPLGEPGVKNNLYDSNEFDDGKYPKHIIDAWVNVPAHDDFVSHDQRIGDDFQEMKKRRYLNKLEDRPEVYTFWVGDSGVNPHKLYGYLDNPQVAKHIADWIAA